MKKISILFACLVAVLSFTSCEADTDPKYNDPTEFVLNTPALANQYYELSEDGTVDFTWSQPNYGYAATPLYKVQVSLDDNFIDTVYTTYQLTDFIYEDSVVVDTVYRDTTVMEIVPDFVELSAEHKLCNAQVSAKGIAEAICKLRGITSEEEYTDEPARAVYFRVRAYIKGVESSEILSNVVKLNQVKGYCAIQSPGFIYLVGSPTGWTEPSAGNAPSYESWRLFEADDAIGSKVYSATFNMPAGDLYFRFYVELGGWGSDNALPSMGPYGADGTNETVVFTNDAYSGSIVPGKGSFAIPGWDGSPMKITVDLNVNSVIIEKVQ